MMASRMASKCGHGNPIGFPFEMHEAKTIAMAPLSTIIFARATALLPGQPPQVKKPVISTGPVSSNAIWPDAAILKSVVPGHISSVCRHRMIPTFIALFPFHLLQISAQQAALCGESLFHPEISLKC
jgi:hypothetical protein